MCNCRLSGSYDGSAAQTVLLFFSREHLQVSLDGFLHISDHFFERFSLALTPAHFRTERRIPCCIFLDDQADFSSHARMMNPIAGRSKRFFREDFNNKGAKTPRNPNRRTKHMKK